MANEKKLIASCAITGIVVVGVIISYFVLAGRWNAIKLKHHPEYSRDEEMKWIKEIAAEHGCQPTRFGGNLMNTVFNCTDNDPFDLDLLYREIRKNLTYPTGEISDPLQSAGNIMLRLTGAFIFALILVGGGTFGIAFGLMFAAHLLARLIGPSIRSTTSQVMQGLGLYQIQVDEEAVEQQESKSSTSTIDSNSNQLQGSDDHTEVSETDLQGQLPESQDLQGQVPATQDLPENETPTPDSVTDESIRLAQ